MKSDRITKHAHNFKTTEMEHYPISVAIFMYDHLHQKLFEYSERNSGPNKQTNKKTLEQIANVWQSNGMTSCQ